MFTSVFELRRLPADVCPESVYRGGAAHLLDGPEFDEELERMREDWKKKLKKELSALVADPAVKKVLDLEARKTALAAELTTLEARAEEAQQEAAKSVVGGGAEDVDSILEARRAVESGKTKLGIVESALAAARAAAEARVAEGLTQVGTGLVAEAKASADKLKEQIRAPLRKALLMHYVAESIGNTQQSYSQGWNLQTALAWAKKEA